MAYIMNLLRNVDLNNPTQKQKDIEHIKKELQRSDSPELKKKIDLIQAFLNEVVIGLNPGEDMDESWAEYEQLKRNEEIEALLPVKAYGSVPLCHPDPYCRKTHILLWHLLDIHYLFHFP